MRIISGLARGTKLYTLEGENTRPTLDRVKEPLFSIIQNYIKDANVLDLFAGSGALGLEALSRGAKNAILCDKSYEAIQIIKKNINKTHFEEKTKVLCMDYKKCLENIQEKLDLIFSTGDKSYMNKCMYDETLNFSDNEKMLLALKAGNQQYIEENANSSKEMKSIKEKKS